MGHADQRCIFSSTNHGHTFEDPAFESSFWKLSEWEGIKGKGRFVRVSFNYLDILATLFKGLCH